MARGEPDMWPDRRLLDLLGIDHPIIQAPMAGSTSAALVVAVSEAGGLGSLPCGALTAEQVRSDVALIRSQTRRPFNLNFFCHMPADPDPPTLERWRTRLAPYYAELGVDAAAATPGMARVPFDAAMCSLVLELEPPVVSFHFGLPEPPLVERIKNAGCVVLSSATTVDEAVWLADHGVDAVIAQGAEAGGHRGMFRTDDVAGQVGSLALIPQIADAVAVPVIAAGGIADGRGIAAALVLGAAGAQLGTAYLLCPEAPISEPYRRALLEAREDGTALTNVFSGRPARGLVNRLVREVGPLSTVAPPFPLATAAVQPLRSRAEAAGSSDFSPLWSGQAAALARPAAGAGDLTRRLAAQAGERMRTLTTPRS